VGPLAPQATSFTVSGPLQFEQWDGAFGLVLVLREWRRNRGDLLPGGLALIVGELAGCDFGCLGADFVPLPKNRPG
jgi:hypothetical protein